jgi:hypothetical protein
MEQLHPDLPFQVADLLAEGRLGDAEFFGGAGEVSLFGNGQKIADVTQFHGI